MMKKTITIFSVLTISALILIGHSSKSITQDSREKKEEGKSQSGLLDRINRTMPGTVLNELEEFSTVVRSTLFFRYRDKISVVVEGGWSVLDIYFRLHWKDGRLSVEHLRTNVHRLSRGRHSGIINQEKILLSRFLRVNEKRFLREYRKSLSTRIRFYTERFFMGTPFTEQRIPGLRIQRNEDVVVVTEPLSDPGLAEYKFSSDGEEFQQFRLSHLMEPPAPYSPAYPEDSWLFNPDIETSNLNGRILIARLNGETRKSTYRTSFVKEEKMPESGLGTVRTDGRGKIQVWSKKDVGFDYRSQKVPVGNGNRVVLVPDTLTLQTSERIVDRRPFRMEFSGDGFHSGGTAKLNLRDSFHVYTEKIEFLRYRFGEEVVNTKK